MVGSIHRSWLSPYWWTSLVVNCSAITVSVCKVKWGPCCSYEPIGRQSTDAEASALVILSVVSRPNCRSRTWLTSGSDGRCG